MDAQLQSIDVERDAITRHFNEQMSRLDARERDLLGLRPAAVGSAGKTP
jgi:hypothetical protein